jgi:hypothetical protein
MKSSARPGPVRAEMACRPFNDHSRVHTRGTCAIRHVTFRPANPIVCAAQHDHRRRTSTRTGVHGTSPAAPSTNVARIRMGSADGAARNAGRSNGHATRPTTGGKRLGIARSPVRSRHLAVSATEVSTGSGGHRRRRLTVVSPRQALAGETPAASRLPTVVTHAGLELVRAYREPAREIHGCRP